MKNKSVDFNQGATKLVISKRDIYMQNLSMPLIQCQNMDIFIN